MKNRKNGRFTGPIEEFIENEVKHLAPGHSTARLAIFRTAVGMIMDQLPGYAALLSRITSEYDAFILANTALKAEPQAQIEPTVRVVPKASKSGSTSKLRRPTQLQLTVIEGLDLIQSDYGVRTDLFVRLRLSGITFTTSPRSGILDPTWNESFVFPFGDVPALQKLEVGLFDSTVSMSEPAGTTTIQLDEVLDHENSAEFWLSLNIGKRHPGSLHFAVKAQYHSAQTSLDKKETNPKVVYGICKGCIMQKRVDALQQITLKDENHHLQGVIAELKDYVEVFMKDIEFKTKALEHLESTTRTLKGTNREQFDRAVTSAVQQELQSKMRKKQMMEKETQTEQPWITAQLRPGSPGALESPSLAPNANSLAPLGLMALVLCDCPEYSAMANSAALELMMALVLSETKTYRGYVARTRGPTLLIAFQHVSDAVRFSISVLRKLLHLPWPHDVARPRYVRGALVNNGYNVRFTINSGEPVAENNPFTGRVEYYGGMLKELSSLHAISIDGAVTIAEAAMVMVDDPGCLADVTVGPLLRLSMKDYNQPISVFRLVPFELKFRIREAEEQLRTQLSPSDTANLFLQAPNSHDPCVTSIRIHEFDTIHDTISEQSWQQSIATFWHHVEMCVDRFGGTVTTGQQLWEGGQFIVTFSSAHDAFAFTLRLQTLLLAVAWPADLLGLPSACREVVDGQVQFYGFRLCVGMHCTTVLQPESVALSETITPISNLLCERARMGDICMSGDVFDAIADQLGLLHVMALPALELDDETSIPVYRVLPRSLQGRLRLQSMDVLTESGGAETTSRSPGKNSEERQSARLLSPTRSSRSTPALQKSTPQSPPLHSAVEETYRHLWVVLRTGRQPTALIQLAALEANRMALEDNPELSGEPPPPLRLQFGDLTGMAAALIGARTADTFDNLPADEDAQSGVLDSSDPGLSRSGTAAVAKGGNLQLTVQLQAKSRKLAIAESKLAQQQKRIDDLQAKLLAGQSVNALPMLIVHQHVRQFFVLLKQYVISVEDVQVLPMQEDEFIRRWILLHREIMKLAAPPSEAPAQTKGRTKEVKQVEKKTKEEFLDQLKLAIETEKEEDVFSADVAKLSRSIVALLGRWFIFVRGITRDRRRKLLSNTGATNTEKVPEEARGSPVTALMPRRSRGKSLANPRRSLAGTVLRATMAMRGSTGESEAVEKDGESDAMDLSLTTEFARRMTQSPLRTVEGEMPWSEVEPVTPVTPALRSTSRALNSSTPSKAPLVLPRLVD
eukprot:TRINITY_DN7085_c0_g1_i1.p1 TRINITY_DN7085_c0_g1~~TRINITY_DN7085_c0_g1_i1.p1  ORF type:complete len:1250 (+),score=174.31 TRINITY_DN7085_c0_g1_i1:173-3922(+)